MKKISGYIERKSMLYKTGVEYGDYTMNHIQGCAHGCKYPCYAFLMSKRFGRVKTYDKWLEPYLVSNTLELLDKEIPRVKTKIHSVHLCFSTDPFMYQYPEIQQMSIAAIKKLNKYGIKCSVLTKGILPSELANLSKNNEYGITLVTTNESYRKREEPGAAPLKKRVEALKYLHDANCKTWVSIEPFPTPNILKQDILKILEKIKFVNTIIFGRMNYNTEVTEFKEYKKFYNEMATEVIDFCNRNNINCHIKEKTIT